MLLEYIFKIGSLAGLVSAGFLIFDRFFKHRPSISLHRQIVYNAPEIFLRVVNNDDSDLAIHKIECSSDRWAIAYHDDTRAIAIAVLNKALSNFVIPPRGTHLFSLIPVPGEGDDPLSEPLTFVMTWNLTGRSWLWRRTTKLKTHTDHISQLGRAEFVAER